MSAAKRMAIEKIQPRRVQRRLMEFREKLGISQQELADTSGVRRTTIANIEAERYFLNEDDAVAIFIALTRLAPPQSPLRRELKEEAEKFIAQAKESIRKERIRIPQMIEQTKKFLEGHQQRLESLDPEEAELDAKASQLAEL